MPKEDKAAKKRIVLFHHYDAENLVDDYVFYTLKKLREQDIDIIFISMSELGKNVVDSLKPYAQETCLLPNKGMDWNGWRTVLLDKGKTFFDKYDEIILMNDSCYGPVFPLEDFFNKMDSKNADFYGITESTLSSYPRHVQSYFLGIGKSIFSSDVFWNFFREMQSPDDYTHIVEEGEIKFSQTLYANNFKSAVYCVYNENTEKVPELDQEGHFVFNSAPYLVRDHNAPFIKIKAFSSGIPGCSNRFNKSADIINALQEKNSDYPLKLVQNHLRRIKPASWHKNLPGTFIVIDPLTSCENVEFPGKIAVFAHIFYEENINMLDRLDAIPAKFDLYVSTTTKEVKEKLEEHIKTSHLDIHDYAIKLVENRGRDVGSWLTDFKRKQTEYDVALKIKDKKSPTVFSGIGHDWKKFNDESLLYSRSYVSKLLNIFVENEKIGLLFPIYPPTLMFLNGNFLGDRKNFDGMKNVMQRCSLRYVEENFIPVFPVGNEFWYRPKALEPLFNAGFSLNDFPPEPLATDGTILHGIERSYVYIAQAVGYEYREVCPLPLLVETFQKYEDFMLRRHGFLNANFVQVSPPPLPPLRHQLFNRVAQKSPRMAKFLYPFAKLAYRTYKRFSR